MIAGHPSEWHQTTQQNIKKRIDLLSSNNTNEYAKKANQFEVDRFLKCEFISQIAGLTQKLWHFHPINYINNNRSCFCNRDFAVDEVKHIVKSLRESEGISSVDLFDKNNCNIPVSDKTYDRFTEELNKVINKYKINTCLRKIHFLAQIYHESDRFRTTQEYASGRDYDPDKNISAPDYGNKVIGDGPKYKGRGLIQLTWKNNYEHYKCYSGIDVVNNYTDISDRLDLAFDSAGWFFYQGKELSTEPLTWRAPHSSPSYVSIYNASYAKKIITYGDPEKRYGTVDLCLVADDDYVDLVSWFVNGGGNGLPERRAYLVTLKETFKYEHCCNK